MTTTNPLFCVVIHVVNVRMQPEEAMQDDPSN
jgi:hypothetical protein